MLLLLLLVALLIVVGVIGDGKTNIPMGEVHLIVIPLVVVLAVPPRVLLVGNVTANVVPDVVNIPEQ